MSKQTHLHSMIYCFNGEKKSCLGVKAYGLGPRKQKFHNFLSSKRVENKWWLFDDLVNSLIFSNKRNICHTWMTTHTHTPQDNINQNCFYLILNGENNSGGSDQQQKHLSKMKL